MNATELAYPSPELPEKIINPGAPLQTVDQIVSKHFQGTEWEIHLIERRPWRFRASRRQPEDHQHEPSNPVDELGGRRVCRRCGHVYNRDEMAQVFFAQMAERRLKGARLRGRRRARRIRRSRR